MRKSLVIVGSVAIVVAGIAPAAADTATLGTSFASAANITPGSGIAPTVSTTGDLSDLLDFLTPVLDQFVAPLTSEISNAPTTVASILAADLGESINANSASAGQSAPNNGDYPDCAASGWDAGNCYNSASADISADPLVSIGTGGAHGWATADSNASSAAAQTSHVTLSALGVRLGDLGTAISSSNCPVGQGCTTSSSVTAASLFNGALAAKSADDGSLLVSINGGDYQPVSALTGSQSVSDGAVTAQVSAAGSALEVSVPLTLDQLLTALQEPDTLDSMGATDAGSTITLDLILGGQDTGTAGNRTAGLRVGLGLSADVEISVYGLLGASLTFADSNGGNLADIQLAYTAATGFDGTGSGGTDPASLK